MNVDLPVIAALLAMVACVALTVWAMAERGRASRAELRVSLLEARGAEAAELVRAQAALSAGVVADQLVQRADAAFEARDRQARAGLEAQLKPVADTLARFQQQVEAAEKARAEVAGGLKAQIEQLLAASVATQEEARKLSRALRRGAGVQGRWGEQMLANVLELAGMQRNVDFFEQPVLASGARPDVVVRLPGGGQFAIDAKCSLTAFLAAQEAVDEAGRDSCLGRHSQSVRGHMQALSAKAYWDQFDKAPDFVAMFVPGDGFLAAAIERAPELYTEAMGRRVILVTPSSLFALCKAVVFGWRVEEQHLNAQQIALLGRDLYKRLSVMGGHVAGMGKALGVAVGRYNEFVGSLETQVLTQARRFEALKVDHVGAKLDILEPVEGAVRPLVKLAESPAAVSSASSVLTLPDAAPTSGA